MSQENARQAKRPSGKGRNSTNKPKWQAQVVNLLFVITLLLVFGFFTQEGLRWLS